MVPNDDFMQKLMQAAEQMEMMKSVFGGDSEPPEKVDLGRVEARHPEQGKSGKGIALGSDIVSNLITALKNKNIRGRDRDPRTPMQLNAMPGFGNTMRAQEKEEATKQAAIEEEKQVEQENARRMLDEIKINDKRQAAHDAQMRSVGGMMGPSAAGFLFREDPPTPEQIEQDAYSKAAGQGRAAQEFPRPARPTSSRPAREIQIDRYLESLPPERREQFLQILAKGGGGAGSDLDKFLMKRFGQNLEPYATTLDPDSPSFTQDAMSRSQAERSALENAINPPPQGAELQRNMGMEPQSDNTMPAAAPTTPAAPSTPVDAIPQDGPPQPRIAPEHHRIALRKELARLRKEGRAETRQDLIKAFLRDYPGEDVTQLVEPLEEP